ncbi:MAG: sigma-70 family RNA polymerase sigma factor [Chitinophagaceae bacterium]|nr:MAG: sigma-70 family RNA polymerase sigma factor [Chitinophagaceae bacterium]
MASASTKNIPHMEIQGIEIRYASDEELVAKIVAGETLLFEVLIRRYNPLLYKIARSYGFGHHDAEDLMQESHIAAYRYLGGFRGAASYKTWLTRIHLNHCHKKSGQPAGAAGVDALPGETEAAPAAGPEQLLINRELGRALEQSLQRIPLAYRSVFVLREVEGFSVAETAALLGITAVNVKVRLSRAKAMLQKQLEQFYAGAGLYEFHLRYCDAIVARVYEAIARWKKEGRP